MDVPANCTIACDEGHLTANKLILCNHSKYLHDILEKYPNADHPIIILTELNITDVRVLVNYMYTGELVITHDTSPTSLLKAAQILKIDSLTADNNNSHNNNNNNSNAQQMVDDHDVDDDGQDADDYRQDVNDYPQDMVDDEQDVHDDDHDVDDDDHDIDEDNYNIDHENPRLINSIKNIYSLDKSMHHTNNPPHNSQQNSSPRGSLDIKPNKIRCHLCNIGLSDVKCLYRHVLTRHLPEKWGYKCEFCDREFSRDDHLMRHYTTKHKNMEFNREKIRETRRLNREMAKNFHDQISTV